MPFSDRTVAAADRLIARYPQPRSALLPLLYLVQHEHGCVTAEGIAFCADKLQLTRAEVQAVATFYEMFEREDPGDWLVTACVNFSCKVRGGQRIFERWVERLGGHRDADAGVTVKHLECLGNCDGAPVVQVNYQNYERLTVEQAEELLEAVRRGEPPLPVNGEPPPRFREVCWRLSGADEDERIHVAAVRAAQADLVDYERPPAQRVLDAPKDLGSPGVRAGGPQVGDAEAATPLPERGDDQAPAGRELDGPARVPGAQGEDTAAQPPDEERVPTSDEEPVGERASGDAAARPDGADEAGEGGGS